VNVTESAVRASALTRLRIETSEIDEAGILVPLADPRRPLLWQHQGEGMVGIGEALRLTFTGPNRITDAAAAWRDLVGNASISDQVDVAGSGLIAFGTFAFADTSTTTSVLIVPRVVVGRRAGRSWVTLAHIEGEAPASFEIAAAAPGDEYRAGLVESDLSPEEYRAAVRSAVERIRRGELSKVVLARQLRGRIPVDADLRRIVSELARGYPDTWTFAVDGTIGASPETLVRVDRGGVNARVLAGTASRGSDAERDDAQAAGLLTSSKDAGEHEFAVRSAVDALRPHTSRLESSPMPFTIELPNLWHLATDLEGTLSDGSSSLDLVTAMHPTAAVAGAPTAAALAVIAELEPFDRGRYAGPVGWVGADGGGEWAIALRSAQVDASGGVIAHAGCGIVADSDPAAELAESTMKFRPISEAFR
jgi:menaquinone-specific isochorismate synthase